MRNIGITNRRTTAAVLVVATVGLAVGGCQASAEVGVAAPRSSARSDSEAPASPPSSPERTFDTSLNELTPHIVPRAVQKFGVNQVFRGTDLAVDFERDFALSEDVITAEAPENLDAVLSAADRMTPSSGRSWKAKVRQYVSREDHTKHPHLANSIMGVALYDAFQSQQSQKGALGLTPEGPAIVNPRLVEVRTDTVEKYLWVRVKSTGDFRVTKGAKTRQMGFHRTMRFWLVPAGKDWKIASYAGYWKFGQLKADK